VAKLLSQTCPNYLQGFAKTLLKLHQKKPRVALRIRRTIHANANMPKCQEMFVALAKKHLMVSRSANECGRQTDNVAEKVAPVRDGGHAMSRLLS